MSERANVLCYSSAIALSMSKGDPSLLCRLRDTFSAQRAGSAGGVWVPVSVLNARCDVRMHEHSRFAPDAMRHEQSYEQAYAGSGFAPVTSMSATGDKKSAERAR